MARALFIGGPFHGAIRYIAGGDTVVLQTPQDQPDPAEGYYERQKFAIFHWAMPIYVLHGLRTEERDHLLFDALGLPEHIRELGRWHDYNPIDF